MQGSSFPPSTPRRKHTARSARRPDPGRLLTARLIQSFPKHLAFILAALAIGWPAPAAADGGFCSPPALGSPCATGGVATLGKPEPTAGFGLGNPAHLANGNKYQLDVDLPPNASAPGLQLIRHYNGLSIQAGALGRNWTLSYDTRLLRRHDGWRLRQADGSVRKVAAPLPAGQRLVVRAPGGRELHFDARGDLVRIRAGGATLLRIDRHAGPQTLAGLIRQVASPTGHTLDFHYGDRFGQPLLKAVDTPLGRFSYDYERPPGDAGHDSPRLVAVTRPDAMRRLYHYEAGLQAGNPYALTGVSVGREDEKAHRLATWQYDRHGRVITLRQHGRAAPSLHIDYLRGASATRPGLTRVRSGNGREAGIRFQRVDGGYRLLSRTTGDDDDPAQTDSALAYDEAGRLLGAGGVRLRRAPGGALAGLSVRESGWPGLAFERDAAAGRHLWRSQATGATTVSFDPAGRPARLDHANGDSARLEYDAQGRPARLERSSGASSETHATRLQWHGPRLRRIEHPNETETRSHDVLGRLTRRGVQRPALLGAAPMRFDEGFEYDAHGRLLRHRLPEGGALHYEWRDAAGRTSALSALRWEDAQGRMRTVIESAIGQPGYRWGNGLELVTAAIAGPHADTLRLGDGRQTLWRQTRRHDAAGRVLQDRHEFPLAGHHDELHFAHDAQSRLRGALHQRPGATTRWWHAWRADGSLAATRRGQDDLLPAIGRDASGLPQALGRFALRYGPGRRLRAVIDADTGQAVAQYRHNAFGHRIVAQAAGRATHYLYLHDQLVAQARSPAAGAAPVVTRRYLHAGLTPVGMIDYPPDGPPRLYAVHADLSGAPRLVTDDARQLRWLASYGPTGQAEQVTGDLRFALRLPGQHADEETGWHDNLLRTYAPELGQYLEPDPLGPLPGTDTFGYARQQPWRYADPHGLLLFAFDGTRHDAGSRSNAWLLSQVYRDGAAHYHSGPGNRSFLDWDAIVAWQAGRILENQWQALLSALEHQPAGGMTPIDIIGFSRGAALARDFGNRVAAHVQDGLFSVDDPMRGRVSACVDLRFMGLFDTVAQFGIGGSHNHLYDFSISEMWSWVAHAVALHEHRWMFPLTRADAGGAGNVVEAPFVGAHADIGGGLALRGSEADAADAGEATDSDLARVALGWMHWQALAASVAFDAFEPSDIQVRSALLRDMRSPLARSLQQGDRAVITPSGDTRLTYQDDDSRLGRAARAQTESFIERYPDWRSQTGETVGTVDMAGYARWLEDTLGWSP